MANIVAVTSSHGRAPGDDTSIRTDGSTSELGDVDVLNVAQLLLNRAAVSTSVWCSPGHHIPRCPDDGRKSPRLQN